MAFRIVGRYLSPFLARLSVAELHSGEVGDALRIRDRRSFGVPSRLAYLDLDCG